MVRTSSLHPLQLTFALVALGSAWSLAGCSLGDDSDVPAPSGEIGADSTAPTRLACSNDPIPGPRDLPPVPNGGLLCAELPLDSFASAIEQSPEELAQLDGAVLAGDCIDVATPSGLTYVIGAALRGDTTGEDYAQFVRLPVPSAVLGGTNVDVPTGTTLLVAKVSAFRGENLLRFVNVATVKEQNGKRFIETLSEAARDAMSRSMKVDGPGLYALYATNRPVGFVSGTVRNAGAPSGGAVVLGTTAPFVVVADADGGYTLPLAHDEKASLAAFDLATRWSGEVHLAVERSGAVNPKTNAPPETPATDSPVEGLDAVNLRGADIELEAAEATGRESTDFESGSVDPWRSSGAVSVLDEQMSTLFPGSKEKRYAFLTTGAGARRGIESRIAREVVVPEGVEELVIDYTFLSQEYPAWVGTIYNDAFVAYVAGDTSFLLAETVTGNDGTWQDFFEPIGNVVESKVSTGDVSGRFGGTTGKRQKRISVEGCSGRAITLVLAVADVGDAIYDSAVAIDRIAFE